jgi:hypothetical protein
MPDIQGFEIEEQRKIYEEEQERNRRVQIISTDKQEYDRLYGALEAEFLANSLKENGFVDGRSSGLRDLLLQQHVAHDEKKLRDEIRRSIDEALGVKEAGSADVKDPIEKLKKELMEERYKRLKSFLSKCRKINEEGRSLIDRKEATEKKRRAHDITKDPHIKDEALDAEERKLRTDIEAQLSQIDELQRSNFNLITQILDEKKPGEDKSLRSRFKDAIASKVISEASSVGAATFATLGMDFWQKKARTARNDRAAKLQKQIRLICDNDQSIAENGVLRNLRLAQVEFLDDDSAPRQVSGVAAVDRGELQERNCYITIPLSDRSSGKKKNRDEYIRAFSEYFGRTAQFLEPERNASSGVTVVPRPNLFSPIQDGSSVAQSDGFIRIQVNNLVQSDKRLDDFIERMARSREKKVEEATLFPKGSGRIGVGLASVATVAPVTAGIVGGAGYLIGEGSARLANLANKNPLSAILFNWFLSPSASLWRGAAEVSCKGIASTFNAFGDPARAERWKKTAKDIAESEKKRLSSEGTDKGKDATRFASVGGAFALGVCALPLNLVGAPLNYIANASAGLGDSLYREMTNKANSTAKKVAAGVGLAAWSIVLAAPTAVLKVPAVILSAVGSVLSKPAEYLWPDHKTIEGGRLFSWIRGIERLNTLAQMRVVEGVNNDKWLEKKPAEGQTLSDLDLLVVATTTSPSAAVGNSATLNNDSLVTLGEKGQMLMPVPTTSNPSNTPGNPVALKLSDLSHDKMPEFIQKLDKMFMALKEVSPLPIERKIDNMVQKEGSSNVEGDVTYTIMTEKERIEITCPVRFTKRIESGAAIYTVDKIKPVQAAAVATAKIGGESKRDFLASNIDFSADDFRIVTAVNKIGENQNNKILIAAYAPTSGERGR